MKINRTHSILLLTAIFHLLADVAIVGDAVLCVGENGHAEVEVGSFFARDCESIRIANTFEGDPEIAAGNATDCTDVPLHAEAEMVSESLSWDSDAPPVLGLSFGSHALSPRGSGLHIGQVTDLTATMRAHRSIVLII